MKKEIKSANEFFDLMEELAKNPKLLKKMPSKMIFAENYDIINKVLSPKRLELIKTINDNEHISVNELAKLLKRKQEAISRDIKILKQMRIINVKRVGNKKISHIEKYYVVVPLVG